ncbi:elongation initiation factor 2 alpha subunit, putative [Leishmania donovani]|uniref:Elongation initiation factor 2 alpha subunit, putative n=1 Tax=Leishmania donovani TaxID=5661 RepID=E9B7W6_LEIDO|nr:elongation initiation factor 2 alpha subunit, putative [Leishmania donovani]CBZ31339.1 elongation initiation factor 2 alpha subunit, putative [Leishmania donovani]
MASYCVTDSPETVDYKTKCCCRTTDNVYYAVPKEYFRLNQSLARRKLLLAEPFPVPVDCKTLDHLLVLLEKATILSAQVVEGETKGSNNERPEWMRDLNKRQQKFVCGCLGITSWDGKDIPFYVETMPKINDVVWVKITQVNDTSAVVQLLEYGKREGIIPYTEVTRRRVRSMGKLIKVGRTEPAQVIRIDKDKGYIDLSKKLVTPNEAKACEAHFRQGNEVRSIVCHVAELCDIPAMDAMEMIAYPLYQREPGKHAWTWLYELNQTEDVERILGPLKLDKAISDCLMSTLKNAMRLKVLTLFAEVEITCFACDGVEAIRDVLILGRSYGEGSDPQIHLSVNIIGPPKYGIRARTDMKEEGIQRMKEAIEAMTAEIKKRGGQLKVVTPPQPHGDADEGKKGFDGEDDDDEDAD